jgi:Protein of unknown function (DUF2281)
MNAQAVAALIEKLKTLPPEQRAEVEDFVDYLKARKERARDAVVRMEGDFRRRSTACRIHRVVRFGLSAGRARWNAGILGIHVRSLPGAPTELRRKRH